MKIQLVHNFQDIISVENLLAAWEEFAQGKRNKPDVQAFSLHLMDNIFSLHDDLISHQYKHDGYKAFNISDPKPRSIHKAGVRDRLLHHAIYRILYPFFDKTFISDSYSCRIGKGTHKALNRFRSFGYVVGQNNTRTCWVLKCDIKKFFANVDHQILIDVLREYVPDKEIVGLLREVIGSFSATEEGIGLPLGNLTSQLLVNVYMNQFDQFVKHKLRAKYYIRYCDDFVFLSEDRGWLELQIPIIKDFLWDSLRLELHPKKVSVKTLASGVDFLGWVNFPDHRVLRTATKRRMLKRIGISPTPETVNSYLGLLGHGNAHKLARSVVQSV